VGAVGVLLADVVGEGAESGFGDEGVEDFEQCCLVVGFEFGDVGELGADGVFGGVQGSSGGVGDDEVVDAGVEDFGDFDEAFEAGGDAPGFVAGDLAGVAADFVGE